MVRVDRFFRTVLLMTCVLAFTAPAAFAATPQPPFFGPPGIHANTVAGKVDVGGTNQDVYPEWKTIPAGTGIYGQSPWSACQYADADYMVRAQITGAIPGKYDRFQHFHGRYLEVDTTVQDADGYYIRANYQGEGWWSNDWGWVELTKSNPSLASYDQVCLYGWRNTAQGMEEVDTTLSLVEDNGYIGVANIASLGVIYPCGAANADSQILLPLGVGANGQPTIIPDINGDGTPDPEFLPGPPISGSGASPVIPTLTEWGLIVMTVLLLILGLRFSKKSMFTPAT